MKHAQAAYFFLILAISSAKSIHSLLKPQVAKRYRVTISRTRNGPPNEDVVSYAKKASFARNANNLVVLTLWANLGILHLVPSSLVDVVTKASKHAASPNAITKPMTAAHAVGRTLNSTNAGEADHD